MGLRSWLSPKVIFADSVIHGAGLFATKAIKKDEVFAYKGGYLFELDEFLSLPKKCQTAGLQIDDDVFIAPQKENEIGQVLVGINHSCKPNAGLNGQIGTVAIRDIEPGEELVADYVVAYSIDAFSFRCKCNNNNCRGTISSTDWKDIELQKKYSQYFSSYMKKKIINNQ